MKKNVLEKLLSDFYTVSGMELSVLDADFHTVAMAKSRGVDFCALIHRAEGAANVCKASDIQNLNKVKTTLEPEIYTCPYGITEAIIPVIRGDAVIAYIISSMGVNTDKTGDEEIISSTESFSGRFSRAKLDASVAALKHLGEAELNSHLSLLLLLAEHISNDETLFFAKESIGKLVKSYIKNNLSSKLTLSDIARNLHCSTVTLTEHFKDEFGITVMEYVTKKRMQLSERLLIMTDMPLREIATHSGFADVEYFSRTFKRFHGIAPAAWRLQEKTKDKQ